MAAQSFTERYREISGRIDSRLCVGLDPNPARMPKEIREREDAIVAFNTAIIEATSDICSAYKLNLAFYESSGINGLQALRQTLERIPKGVLVIGDAKRGDIGNTAERYAEAMLKEFNFDAVTVNPYMGTDTLKPYFDYPGKGVIVLALTSNPGSAEFQRLDTGGTPLYQRVIDRCTEVYGNTGALGFVIGATHPDELGAIRDHVGPDIPLLIPGLGAQGGDPVTVARANAGGAAFFNVSRGIAHAGDGPDFAEKAREAALGFLKGLREGEAAHAAP